MSADTSAEALDRLLYQARYCPTLTDADWEEWRATLRALAAERDALRGERDSILQEAMNETDRLTADRDRLAAEVGRLQKALSFYADVRKYPAPLTGGLGALYFDCGQIARAALGENP